MDDAKVDSIRDDTFGLLKRDELAHYKDPVAIDLMRSLKAALDPGNILNPGKVLAVGSDLPAAMPHVAPR